MKKENMLKVFWLWSKTINAIQSVVNVAAAAAAKLFHSCLTLCDPIEGSPPGSLVPGILQARTLQWVAISFSNAWKWKVKVKSLSRVRLFATPWTAAYQGPPPMGFSRQDYWSGLPLPSQDAWEYVTLNTELEADRHGNIIHPCLPWSTNKQGSGDVNIYIAEYIIQNGVKKPCLISCTWRVKFADKFMWFNLLNTPLLRFFSLISLRTQLILRLVRCFPQLLMDIKSVREKRTKFDAMFKLAVWGSDSQLHWRWHFMLEVLMVV